MRCGCDSPTPPDRRYVTLRRLYGLLLNCFPGWAGDAGRLLPGRAGDAGRLPGPGGPASAGQPGQGGGGEVAGGQGLEQVVDGAGEGPLGGGLVLAAHGQLAEAHVVLDVAVGGLGDVAALAVGSDPVAGFQPFAHGLDGGAAPVRAGGVLVLVTGGFLQVAAFPGGDEPVRPGAGQVGFGAVARVGQHQPDP